jgi:hypothetical protein
MQTVAQAMKGNFRMFEKRGTAGELRWRSAGTG